MKLATKIKIIVLVIICLFSFGCKREKHTVTFLNYNGEVISIEQIEHNSSANAPVLPTRDGYVFVKWSTSFDRVTENIIVTPIYKLEDKPIHNVVLKENETSTTIKVQDGNIIGAIEHKEIIGKDFVGWFVNGKQWDVENDIVYDDMTLVAQYTTSKCKVYLDTQGGTYYDPIEYQYGDKINISEIIPSREGYKFLGWDNYPKIIYEKEIRVIALWEPITYEIMVDYNYNSHIEILKFNYGENINISIPKRDYYEFLGWNEQVPDTMPANNIKLVASWRYIPNEFEIYNNAITKYIGNEENVIIPEYYYDNGLKVYITEIGESAFENCNFIKTIELTNYINTIGKDAFKNCDQLNVNIYNNQKYLPFCDNDYYALIDIIDYSIKDVKLHENVNILTDSLLINYSELETLTIYYNSYLLKNTISDVFDSLFNNNVPSSIKYNVIISSDVYSLNDYVVFSDYINTLTINKTIKSLNCYLYAIDAIYFAGTIDDWLNVELGDEYYINWDTPIYMLDSNNNYCNLETIIVPDTIHTISSYRFQGFLNLKYVDIPESVEIIETAAFRNCENLKAVMIPESVHTIESYAFPSDISHIFYKGEAIPSEWEFSLDDIIYSLGSKNFKLLLINDMYYLIDLINNTARTVLYIGDDESIIIPSTISDNFISYNVEILGSYTFDNSNIKNVTVPSSIKKIESSAFNACNELKKVYIPTDVEIIEEGAIIECNNALIQCSHVKQPETWHENWTYSEVIWNYNLNYYTYKDIMYYINFEKETASVYKCLDNYSEITIPDTVFLNSKYYPVVEIMSNAFKNCVSTKIIYIGTNIEIIKTNAFYNCENLRSLNIPTTVKNVESNAIQKCYYLNIYYENNTIPTEWGKNWFDSNSELYMNSQNIHQIGNFKYYFDKSSKTAQVVEYVGNNKEEIIYMAISFEDVEYKVNRIKSYAFFDKDSLKSLYINENIEYIESYAIHDCDNVIIYTRHNDKPSNWSSWWNYDKRPVFWNIICTGAGGSYNKTSINGFEYILDHETYSATVVNYINTSTSISIPSCIKLGNQEYQITKISGLLFSQEHYESITIPSTLLYFPIIEYTNFDLVIENLYFSGTLDDYMNLKYNNESGYLGLSYVNKFYVLNNNEEYELLNNITISGENKEIEDKTFYGLNNNITTLTIEEGVEIIGELSFAYSKIKKVIIPKSIKTIEMEAFKSCIELHELYYQGTIEDWCNIDFYSINSNPSSYASKVYFLDKNNNYYIPNEIILTDNIKSIGNYQFYNFKLIENIILEEGIESIGLSAFSGCSKLMNIEFPDSINKVEHNAFDNCNLLQFSYDDQYKYLGNKDNKYLILFGLIDESATECYIDLNKKMIYSFKNAKNLINVYFNGNLKNYNNIQFLNEFSNPLYNDNCKLWLLGSDNNYHLLNEIVIPEGTSVVKDSSFYNYNEVINVTIPNSVKVIENNAFLLCEKLENVYYKGTIDEWCNINFYNEYSTPMAYANHFYILNENGEYYEPTDIFVSDEVSSFSNYQFYGFDNIVSISLPFVGSSLNDSNNKYFSYIFGNTQYNNSTIPLKLKSIEIRNDNEVYPYMFYGLPNIVTIKVNSNITTIGDYAFYNCSSLTSIEIPNSVTSIGYCSFYDCVNLTTIKIPNSVAQIKSNAFAGCTQIVVYCEFSSKPLGWSDYCFPSTRPIYWTLNENFDSPFKIVDSIIYKVDSIDLTAQVLGLEKEIENVNIPSTISYDGINYSVTSIHKDAFCKLKYIHTVQLPNSITVIPTQAFYECTSLETVHLTNSITNIEEEAFYGCTKLKNINLPDKLTFIASGVFWNCKSLETITLGDNITKINQNAFRHCSALQSIDIHKNITTISNGAFYGCNNLKYVFIPKTVSVLGFDVFTVHAFTNNDSIPSGWSDMYDYNTTCGVEINEIVSLNDALYIIDKINNDAKLMFALGDYIQIEDEIIVDSKSYKVDQININCFENSKIQKVLWNNNIDNIPSKLFYEISTLKEIVLTESVKIIEESAFSSCVNLENVELNYGLEEIGSYAFFCCIKLTKIIVPNSVKKIGESAFKYCYKLSTISLPFVGYTEDISVTTEFQNELCYIFSDHNWNIPKNIKKVIITGSKDIPDYAFENCSGIECIELSDEIENIGRYAFRDCTSLKYINIPKNVTLINYGLFSGCSSLDNLHIHENIKTIETNAFSNCSITKGLIIPMTVSSISYNAFDFIKNIKLYFEADRSKYNLSYSLPAIYNFNIDNLVIVDNIQYLINNEYKSAEFISNDSNNKIHYIPENISINDDIYSVHCWSQLSYIRKVYEYTDKIVIYSGLNDDYQIYGKNIHIDSRYFNIWLNNKKIIINNDYIYELNKEDYTAKIVKYIGTNNIVDIPEKIHHDSEKFIINEISEYGFSDNEQLNLVKINSNIATIGYCAFSGISKLIIVLKMESIPETFDPNWNINEYYTANYKLFFHEYILTNSDIEFIEQNQHIYILTDNHTAELYDISFKNNLLFVPEVISYNGNDYIINVINSLALEGVTQLYFGPNIKIIKNNTVDLQFMDLFYSGKIEQLTMNLSSFKLFRKIYIQDESGLYKEIDTIYINQEIINNSDVFFQLSPNYILNIYLDNDVTYIKQNFFEEVYNYNLYYNGTVEEWCNILFENGEANPMCYCSNMFFIDENGKYKKLDHIIIPKSVTIINDFQFYGYKNVEKIELHSNIKHIGEDAFYSSYLGSKTDIYFNGSLLDWFNINFVSETSNPKTLMNKLYMKDKYNKYYEITEITIPKNITHIGNYQFASFDKISKINIHSNVISIGEGAFYNNIKLKNIYIPLNVTMIGSYAFDFDYELLEHRVIYCEANEKPEGWGYSWCGDYYNSYFYEVYWNIKNYN